MFVAFGGGVATDVVSVAASLYRRGIPVIRLPSSLIGQVDAGIGLKSAVNLKGVKSALGGFHTPEVVMSDPDWLRSLRPRALRAGMSEIVKIAIVRDPALFDDIAAFGRDLITTRFVEPRDVADASLRRAIELMLCELQANPFEEELARVVDFGHTFSPLLESVSEYRLNHGEAVAVDMAVSRGSPHGSGSCRPRSSSRSSACCASCAYLWSRRSSRQSCSPALRTTRWPTGVAHSTWCCPQGSERRRSSASGAS